MNTSVRGTFVLLLLAGPASAQETRERPVEQPKAAETQVEQPKAPPATSTAASGTASAAPAPAKAPPTMAPGLGAVTFGGILQAMYSAGSSDVVNTFKLRRAELKFIGVFSPRVKWTIMADLAKSLKVANSSPNQSTLPLQDAFITLKAAPRFDIQAGQFLLPLTYEGGGMSSARVETAERSLMITDGKLGQVRDLGVQVTGRLATPVRLKIGVFNSTGDLQNTTAVEGQKAIIARLEVKSPIAGLSLGTSGAASGRDSTGRPRHDRIGGDVEYVRQKLAARAEFMRAWDGTDVRLGYYGLAAYTFRDVMLVGRYDVWDNDRRAAPAGIDERERDIVSGFAWLIEGANVQLRANYVFRLLSPLPQRDQVTVQLQSAW